MVLGPNGGNTLSTNRIGWEVSGSTGIAAGNAGAGILIDGSSGNSIVTGKINGNSVGIVIRASGGSAASGNSIGNVGIGENQNNTGAISNTGAGVEIDGSGGQPVTGNHVGGALGFNTIVGNGAEECSCTAPWPVATSFRPT